MNLPYEPKPMTFFHIVVFLICDHQPVTFRLSLQSESVGLCLAPVLSECGEELPFISNYQWRLSEISEHVALRHRRLSLAIPQSSSSYDRLDCGL